MTSFLQPQARQKLQDVTICVSLANLSFLKRWYDLEHLQSRSMDYFRVAPSDPTLLIATLTAVGLLSVALWCIWQVVLYVDNERVFTIARACGVLSLIYPIETVRRYWNAQAGHTDWGSTIPLLGIDLLLLIGAGLVLKGNDRVLRAGHRVLLMMIFLLPALLINLAMTGADAPVAAAYADKPSLPYLPPRATPKVAANAVAGKAAPRLIWILFDELDQRLAFDERQPGVEMPEMDRLRGESFVANRVLQTAGSTLPAIPSLLTGRIFGEADAMGVDKLIVRAEGSPQDINWRDQPNVFQRARELGANAAVIGWHHPYCRVLGDSLVDCYNGRAIHFPPLLRERSAAQAGVWKTVAFLFRLQWVNLVDLFKAPEDATAENLKDEEIQVEQQQQYFAIRDRAYREAADKRIDFLYVHFPTPHLFAIYDHKRKDFSLSSETNYFDNLALVDRTVGELRSKLEKEGMWDSTTILITADHGLRWQLWHGRFNWNEEFDRLMDNGYRSSPTVPFILKLAGQREGTVYDESFSGVVTGDLSLAVLSGEISTPEQASKWLTAHSGQHDVSAASLHAQAHSRP